MTYANTALTLQATYASIHVKQVYDAIATQLGTVASWSLVDTVDWIDTTFTWRSFVWKCASATSGLPSDFFVIFRMRFTTSGTVWDTASAILSVLVAQDYDTSTNVATKMCTAASATNVTLNSDLTLPTTWDLDGDIPTTAGAVPARAIMRLNSIAAVSIVVAARTDHFIASLNADSSSASGRIYAGAIESLMNSTDDPMPVVLAQGIRSSDIASSTFVAVGTPTTAHNVSMLRHPKLTPAGSYNYVGMACTTIGLAHGTGDVLAGIGYGLTAGTAIGTAAIGGASTAPLFAGVPATKIPVTTCGSATTGVSRGGPRGFLKGIRCGVAQANANGDLYTVDAVTHISTLSGTASLVGFVDTTL